ncbi:MAG: hypothetical protein EPN91_02450 [Salinibacterium sp.]|nr:MAG: hypothetical protein EPN91_02450 [Salinibacterium sp.]
MRAWDADGDHIIPNCVRCRFHGRTKFKPPFGTEACARNGGLPECQKEEIANQAQKRLSRRAREAYRIFSAARNRWEMGPNGLSKLDLVETRLIAKAEGLDFDWALKYLLILEGAYLKVNRDKAAELIAAQKKQTEQPNRNERRGSRA